MAPHADADNRQLANLFIGDHFAITDSGLDFVQQLACLGQVCLFHRERDVGGGNAGAVAGSLHNHVNIDGGFPEGLEDASSDSGLIGHSGKGDLGLVFIEGDAADDHALHVLGFFFHNRAWIFI